MYSAGRKLKEVDDSCRRLRARIALRRQRCRVLTREAVRPIQRFAGIYGLFRLTANIVPLAGIFQKTRKRTSRGLLWLKILLQAWRIGLLLRTRRRESRG